MTSPILVTGGTGTLGRLVVPLLREAGHTVRVLTRHAHDPEDGVTYVAVDLLKGEGIEAAVSGVDTVIHLAGGPKGDDEGTRNLVRAAAKAEVTHFVYISVIGADKLPIGYFKAKAAAEEAIVGSGLPYTILRAAQFHDFALDVAQKMTKMPIVPVPSGMQLQPVDAREVAARLVELALGAPAGRVPDLAGPKVYDIRTIITDYLTAAGKKRMKMKAPLPGKVGKAYKAGDNLTLDAAKGTRTWEAFLAERVS